MGVYEVTIGQFRQFMGTVTSRYSDGLGSGDSLPVYKVSWFEADSFCKWLTANDPDGYTYRLPTEAEWEYCCRAGSDTTWYSGADTLTTENAHYQPRVNWEKFKLKSIGSYLPNGWGLYDMHGNAEEWCSDWYGLYIDSALTNPGGRTSGDFKCTRGSLRRSSRFYQRCATRAALPPAIVNVSLSYIGFRVVISETAPQLIPADTSKSPYQINVQQKLDLPATTVTGTSFTDAEGNVFRATSMTRSFYSHQKDSIVYVSTLPVTGDSGTSRTLAGAYAHRLSSAYGVLYRIANKYELYHAGIIPDAGSYYLAIIPQLDFTNSTPHHDSSYYFNTRIGSIPSGSRGPLYSHWNHDAAIEEAPNGDLLACWYTCIGEDYPIQNIAVSRKPRKSNVWGTTSLLYDTPSLTDREITLWNDGKGNLFQFAYTNDVSYFPVRVSSDNGASWSSTSITNGYPGKFIERLGGDTVVGYGDESGFAISPDGGYSWQRTGISAGSGYHPFGCVLDNGKIFLMLRSGNINNSNGISTMAKALTDDYGSSWQRSPTPFKPLSIGQYAAMLKLQSGRLLVATFNGSEVILAESVDQGTTWFCRRKLPTSHMKGYMDMAQGSDGIIHLIGTNGSTSAPGNQPYVSFSEDYLRGGSCLDVAQWGINTEGTISDCSTTEPAYFDTACSDCGGNVTAETVSQKYKHSLTAFPNPFNPDTEIRYSLNIGEKGVLVYTLYDANGKIMKIIPIQKNDGTIKISSGKSGINLSSGVYYGQISINGRKALSHKIVFMK
jgi:hypothetical protein